MYLALLVKLLKIVSMKPIKPLLILVFAVLVFSQCNKEEDAFSQTINEQGERALTFGEISTNLIVNNNSDGNYLWQSVNYLDSILIDIDSDGSFDFNLKNDYYYSNGYGTSLIVELIPLNPNFEIATENQPDTLKVTTRSWGNDIYTVTFNSYSNYSVSNPVNTLNPSPFTSAISFKVNTLATAQTWSQNSVMLCQKNNHFSYSALTLNEIDRGFWQSEEKKYLLFKKTVGNDTKLGWIKLSRVNDLKVTLWEYAIEN